MTKAAYTLAALGLASGIVLAGPAYAQAPAPSTSVSGLIFTDYRGATARTPQGFNVTRAYLTGKARLDPTWSGQVTVNMAPMTWESGLTTTTGFFATPGGGVGAAVTGVTPITRTEPHAELLQMAFLQGDNLLYTGSTMQLGMVYMPWSETEYTYWDYRMLGNTPIEGGIARWSFGDATPRYIQTWDKGLKWQGNHGWLRYNLAIANGEGYNQVETDGAKALEGTVTVSPLPGLDLAFLGRHDNPVGTGGNSRMSLLLGYTNPTLRVGLQGTMMNDLSAAGVNTAGQILSAFGSVGIPVAGLPLELLLRADSIDPNTAAGNDDRIETILGLGLRPTRNLLFVLDNQNVSYNTAGGATSNNLVALHGRVSF